MTERIPIRGAVDGQSYMCALHGDHWHVTAGDLPPFEIPVALASEWPATVQGFAEDWIRRASELRRMAEARMTRELRPE